jgi:hypothetical protein
MGKSRTREIIRSASALAVWLYRITVGGKREWTSECRSARRELAVLVVRFGGRRKASVHRAQRRNDLAGRDSVAFKAPNHDVL